jgi:hypothetical protein
MSKRKIVFKVLKRVIEVKFDLSRLEVLIFKVGKNSLFGLFDDGEMLLSLYEFLRSIEFKITKKG